MISNVNKTIKNCDVGLFAELSYTDVDIYELFNNKNRICKRSMLKIDYLLQKLQIMNLINFQFDKKFILKYHQSSYKKGIRMLI